MGRRRDLCLLQFRLGPCGPRDVPCRAPDSPLIISGAIQYPFGIRRRERAQMKLCRGKGNGNPLHYACLKNPVDRGASGLQSMGWQRVRHNRATEHTVSTRRGGSGELGDSRPASVSGRNTWMSELGGCVGERTWAPEAREAEVQGSGTPEAGQERDGGPQSRLGGGVAHGPRDSAQPSRALASGHFHFSLSRIGEGNGNPLQCSCLEYPMDGGAR